MQFFYWIVLLIAIGIAVFAIQNSNAPQVTIQLLLWPIKTSLVYTILGSIVLGVIITLLFWIPRAIRSSFEWQKVPKEVPRTSHNPFKKRRPL
jgi:uncharacterized integral membrane protein